MALHSVATFNAVAAGMGADIEHFRRFIDGLTDGQAGGGSTKKIDEIEAMEFELPDFAVADE